MLSSVGSKNLNLFYPNRRSAHLMASKKCMKHKNSLEENALHLRINVRPR